MQSFSVGAIFEVDPGNSQATLGELAEGFERLENLIQGVKDKLAGFGEMSMAGPLEGLQGLDRALTATGEKADALGTSIKGAFDSSAGSAQAAIDKVNALAEAYGRVDAAAQAGAKTAADSAAVNGFMAGRRGRSGGGSQGDDPAGWNPESRADYPNARYDNQNRDRIARANEPSGGGLLSGMQDFAEVLAGYGAEKVAMQEDLALRQTLIGLDIDPDSPQGQADMARLRSGAYGAAKGTIFSEGKASGAMPEAAPVLGFSGQEGVDKFQQVYPTALRLGELSWMRGKGSLGSESVAGIELAHLTDTYEPVPLEKELDLANAIAKRVDTSIARQASIMKYGLPVAMAAGIDPNRAMEEMGASEQILGPTSTVGTGYAQMLLGVLHSGGGLNAHLAPSARAAAKHAEHDLMESLKLDPDALKDYQHATKGSKHDDAMKELGFTDSAVAAAKKEGTLDQFIENRIHAYSHDHPDKAFNELIDAFGLRGGRYAEHYMAPDALAREQRYIKGVEGALPVRKEQEKLAEGSMQQFEQMLANMSNIGNTLATATLPMVDTALHGFNTALVAVNDFLKGHEHVAEAGGAGMLVAGGAALVMGTKGLIRAGGNILSGIGRGAAGLAEGAIGTGEGILTGAAEGGSGLLAAGGGLLASPAVIGGAAVAGLLGAGAASGAMQVPMVDDYGRVVGNWGGGGPGHLAAADQKPAQQTVHAPITVTVGPVTMTGTDEHSFHDMLARLTESVKHALSTATGSAQGSDVSPFIYGAVP